MANLGLTPDIASWYQQNLGRPGDQAGIDYWTNMINSGQATQQDFFNSAAKEMQIDDTGLDPSTDAYDERRIANAMNLYSNTPELQSIGGYYNAAGDTRTTSAADRFGGYNANAESQNYANNLVRPSTPKPPVVPEAPVAPAVPAAPAYTKNPYLDEMAAGITSQMNDNWTRNLAPSIRSGAMAAGGFGGSRQGVVEANGLNDMNRSLGQNLTNLYGTDWTNAQNRNLQQQSISNNYDLGLRSSDLGWANYGLNENNSNFNNQLSSANFGLNAYNTMNNNTNLGLNAATTIQNTPAEYNKYFSNNATQIAGQGGTTSSTQPGNPYVSAIGGATMANKLYNTY